MSRFRPPRSVVGCDVVADLRPGELLRAHHERAAGVLPHGRPAGCALDRCAHRFEPLSQEARKIVSSATTGLSTIQTVRAQSASKLRDSGGDARAQLPGAEIFTHLDLDG